MELRVKFDTVIVSNPKNWRDLAIRYERDEVLRGLFVQYSSTLEFTGDAYDAFVTARDTQLCEKIDVDLEIRCSRFDSWGTLFSGVILVQDSKNITCNGIAEVTIEQNDVNHFFYNNLEFGVDLFGGNDDAGSQSWNDVPLFNVPSGTTTGIPALTYGYPIDTMFADILERNGSGMGLSSTFLTTANVSQVIRMDFTVAPAAGDTVELIVTDEWGHQHTYQCEANATPATTWTLWEQVLLMSTNSSPTTRMGEAADVTRSSPGGGVLQRFDITFHFGTTIVSSSAGTGTVSTTTQTAHVFGADSVRFADSSSIRGGASDWYVFSPGRGATGPGRYKKSFRDFFETLAPVFDLGLTLTDAGLVRIEEAEYFLDDTPTVTFREVEGIVEEYDDRRFGSNVLLSYKNNTDGPGCPNCAPTELDYDLPDFDCDDQLDRRSEIYNLEGEQIEQDSKASIDPDSEYLIYSDDDLSQATKFKYRVYDTSGLSFNDNFYYNIPIADEAQILRNKYTLPSITYYAGDYTKAYTVAGGFSYTSSEPATTLAEGAGFAPVILSFNLNISFANWQLITDSQQITINSGADPANDKDCFIESVEYRVFEHKGVFRLSTKDN